MAAKRVLILEPVQADCVRLKSVIEALGYSVEAVSDGDSAAAIFDYYRPDVVFTAFPVQLINRTSFAYFVKRQSSLPATPVVAVVPTADRRRAQEAIAGGCDDFVSKPVDPEEIGAKLHNLVGPPGDSPPMAEH